MTIPSEIAKQILHYLSPCDLGRAAQVNKKWRDVVYSKNCWNLNKLWEVKSDSLTEFYSGLEIPSNACHIGEPTPACFCDWSSLVRKSIFHTSVPFCVLESENFDTYLQCIKKLWIRLGRPCIHTNHYKWYDVYRGREFLRKLSPADQQRVFYRHCRFVIEHKIVDTNPYRFWLQQHIESSLGYHYSLLNSFTVSPKSDHPADIIAANVRNKEHNRLVYMNKHRETVFEKFHVSLQKLRLYGKREFDKKDLDWSELFESSNEH